VLLKEIPAMGFFPPKKFALRQPTRLYNEQNRAAFLEVERFQYLQVETFHVYTAKEAGAIRKIFIKDFRYGNHFYRRDFIFDVASSQGQFRDN
jgi:hypothetical protein